MDEENLDDGEPGITSSKTETRGKTRAIDLFSIENDSTALPRLLIAYATFRWSMGSCLLSNSTMVHE